MGGRFVFKSKDWGLMKTWEYPAQYLHEKRNEMISWCYFFKSSKLQVYFVLFFVLDT